MILVMEDYVLCYCEVLRLLLIGALSSVQRNLDVSLLINKFYLMSETTAIYSIYHNLLYKVMNNWTSI